MRIHFIGIGERPMGDLAAALCMQGHTITGSDETFSDLVLQHAASRRLMPDQLGWFPQKIEQDLDKVVVGRQVYIDNPELKVAQQMGLPICSYPEYIYAYAQDKQRIVIIGEKKTLICNLVLHVLACLHKECDYVVDSAKLEASVRLSEAPIMLLEGDMAPSSSTDSQPQSLRYQHNIVLISGIGWEASPTYPTLETYLQQITNLADASPKGGTLVYCEENHLVNNISSTPRADVKREPYSAHPHRHEEAQAYLITPQGDIPFPYTDIASMRAVAGAQQLVHNLAITDQQFYTALATFRVE